MVGPVIPLLAAPAPPNTASTGNGSSSGNIQYLSWQPTSNPNPNLIRKQQPLLPMLDSPATTTTSTAVFPNNPSYHHHHHHHMVVVPSSTPTVSTSGTTCQDCGNQAKKDCVYRRCRTCCKSRQFVCPTHVRSTWVPAARRRERQHLAATTSGSKKPRLVTSNSNSHTSTSNTPRSFDTSSSHQDGGSFPWHVRAPAEFRCVRVTSIDDDGEDVYAYQAIVRIGGHVFKGFLYDQGVEDAEDDGSVGGEDKLRRTNTNNYSPVPNLSELHLGGGGAGGGGARGDMGGSSSGLLVGVPPDVFGSGSGGSMVGGTAYGTAMN